MEKDYLFREITEHEVDSVYKLESESYPEDEAASLEMLMYRRTEAPTLTIGCYLQDTLIAFVCGSRYDGTDLTHESMSVHIPTGESVCIHSVVVQKEFRRQGVAVRLLAEFVKRVWQNEEGVARILLMCKKKLIPLYTRAGFTLKGKSPIVHGKDPWYELEQCQATT